MAKPYNIDNNPDGFQSEEEVIAHFGYNPWSPRELKECSEIEKFCLIKLSLPKNTLIDLVRNGESGYLYGISTEWEFKNGKITYINDSLPEDVADKLVTLIVEVCPTSEREDETSYWISDEEVEYLKTIADFYAEEKPKNRFIVLLSRIKEWFKTIKHKLF
jgi:hypothetical protein